MLAATELCVQDEIPQCFSASDSTSADADGPIHGVSIVVVFALWSHQGFQLPPDLGMNFSGKWLSTYVAANPVVKQCLALVPGLGHSLKPFLFGSTTSVGLMSLSLASQ